MVDLNQTAWTCGNDYYSRHSINVELSGFASKGYTEAQYRSLAAYFVWCKKQGVIIPLEYTGKSGKNGIIYHSDIPDPYKPGYFGGFSNHTDPGALFDCDKFIKYVNEIEAAELFDFRHVPETDKALAYGFKSLWEKLEKQGDNLNLRMLGYPVTDEFNFVFSTGEAYTIQMFERGGLIYDPTASNEWKIRQMTLRQVSEVYSKL
jgi:N-acetyl-anhydromuramyl-L-alanine amidase AmpD